MRNDIKTKLEDHKDIHEFSLRNVQESDRAVRIVGEEPPKSIRNKQVEKVGITVLNHHDHEGNDVTGDAWTEVNTNANIDEQIDGYAHNSRQVHNPRWHLPEPQHVTPVVTADPRLLRMTMADLNGYMLDMQGRFLDAIRQHDGVELSQFEVGVSTAEKEIVTSTGFKSGTDLTQVSLEVVLLGTRNGTKTDYVIAAHACSLDGINPEALIAKYAPYVLDKVGAGMAEPYLGPIVVRDEAAKDVLAAELMGRAQSPLIVHAEAATVHSGRSLYEVGKSILIEKVKREDGEGYTNREREILGDTLTITSDPLVDMAMGSTPYSLDGIPGRRVTFVKDGVLQCYLAISKHAAFLGVEPTGPVGNIIVEPGTQSVDDLIQRDGPLLVVSQFSSFTPDADSGKFNAEVRFGYQHFPDGRQVPVSSGTVVEGNIFEAMANMHLSSEVQSAGGYKGPLAVRLNNVQVSGK